ncbi:unnamed protein product, partial [Vitis vinifera]|uniref:Uncharacterized protein n=1 Tax=Vitis vinifera TaxID=29760 RepID=D7U0V5_VITVI
MKDIPFILPICHSSFLLSPQNFSYINHQWETFAQFSSLPRTSLAAAVIALLLEQITYANLNKIR